MSLPARTTSAHSCGSASSSCLEASRLALVLELKYTPKFKRYLYLLRVQADWIVVVTTCGGVSRQPVHRRGFSGLSEPAELTVLWPDLFCDDGDTVDCEDNYLAIVDMMLAALRLTSPSYPRTSSFYLHSQQWASWPTVAGLGKGWRLIRQSRQGSACREARKRDPAEVGS